MKSVSCQVEFTFLDQIEDQDNSMPDGIHIDGSS